MLISTPYVSPKSALLGPKMFTLFLLNLGKISPVTLDKFRKIRDAQVQFIAKISFDNRKHP